MRLFEHSAAVRGVSLVGHPGAPRRRFPGRGTSNPVAAVPCRRREVGTVGPIDGNRGRRGYARVRCGADTTGVPGAGARVRMAVTDGERGGSRRVASDPGRCPPSSTVARTPGVPSPRPSWRRGRAPRWPVGGNDGLGPGRRRGPCDPAGRSPAMPADTSGVPSPVRVAATRSDRGGERRSVPGSGRRRLLAPHRFAERRGNGTPSFPLHGARPPSPSASPPPPPFPGGRSAEGSERAGGRDRDRDAHRIPAATPLGRSGVEAGAPRGPSTGPRRASVSAGSGAPAVGRRPIRLPAGSGRPGRLPRRAADRSGRRTGCHGRPLSYDREPWGGASVRGLRRVSNRVVADGPRSPARRPWDGRSAPAPPTGCRSSHGVRSGRRRPTRAPGMAPLPARTAGERLPRGGRAGGCLPRERVATREDGHTRRPGGTRGGRAEATPSCTRAR